MEELGGAYLAAVRRWVEAHAAAAEGKDPDPNPSPAARAALDTLPGPRLLCDNLFTSEMREVRSGLDLGLGRASSGVFACIRWPQGVHIHAAVVYKSKASGRGSFWECQR